MTECDQIGIGGGCGFDCCVILILIVITGCMTNDERDLYRKVSVSCKIIAVNSTEYRWDNIVVEFPDE